jgi:ABC-type multidrug transport system permease subunit
MNGSEYKRNIGFFHQVYHIAWSDLMFLKHNFINVFVMTIMGPLLYLVAFGYGLRSGTTDIGVSYIAFVIPGIMALTSLSGSFASTSTRINVQRLYYKSFDEMMLCPISMPAIVLGKSMLGLIRGLVGCFLMYALGLVLAPDLQLTPLAVISVILSCMVFSMLGMMAALLAKSHQSMATFNSLIILPMTFLCGTFFSVSSLDTVFQAILYCLPLTHSSLCIRAACLPDYLDFPWASLVVIIVFGAIVFLINYHLLKTRKI